MLIPGVTLSHQGPFFQAMDLWALSFLRCCACTVLMLLLFSHWVPCPALPFLMGLTGCHPSTVPTGSQSPLHLLQPLLHNITPCLGLCSSPAMSGSKKPLPDQTLPLLTTPWKYFIPTMCSHSCYFKTKCVWTLLKPAGQGLVFLKGLIFHCR